MMVDVVTRTTTRDSFLTNPDVVELSKWIASRFGHASGWMHTYVDRKTGDQWSCCGLADASRQYSWRGKSWRETMVGLDRLRHDLRDGVDRGNAHDVVAVCEQVLRWGGVSARNVPYLRSRRHVIVAQLQHLRAVLAENRTPSRSETFFDPDDPATECRMNAGFAKIYSLLCDYCLMYDGRVGAALGLLVRQFCEETGRSVVPHSLAFAFGSAREGSNPKNPKVRNPSRGSLRFPKLRQDSRFHTKQVMRANWLLRRTLEENPRTFSEGEDGFHELAAGLFMVGYDLGPATATE